MNESFKVNLPDMLPFGAGYYLLLANSRGEAEDFVFLAVDAAFERLTGLRREDVLGKRASVVFRDKKYGGFQWLSWFGSIVRSGKTQETTQWIEEFGGYFKVTVISSDRETFTVIIQKAAAADTENRLKPESAPEDLEAIFNSTHDAMLLVGYSDGKFRYIRNNETHRRLTGITNIEGATPDELLGKELGEKLRAYYEECRHTGRRVTFEQTYNFAPGKRIWQTEISPVSDSGGIRYLLCTSKDVTDLKAVQDENELLVRRLQTMFNRHNAVMLLIEPVSGKIVDANPAASRFYGYSKEELLSLFITDINTHPVDQTERVRLAVYEQEQRYFLFPHRLKNGEIRMVDVYSSPIPDGDHTLLYSIIFDVTDREAYRNGLISEKEILSTTLQSIGDGVVTTDSCGRITGLNSVAEEITGWKFGETAGRPFADVFNLQNEETGQSVENPIQKVLETGRIVGLANHTVLINRKGNIVPIADSAAPIRMEDGQTFGVVMVFRDVSKDKEQSEQIRYLSYHDPLTGLYNRRFIEEAMNRLDVEKNLPISVIMGDVNGLKITNDVFGHKAGDLLLQHVAATLERNCHKGDLVARWGGDEFVIFMPQTKLVAAEEIIQQIKNSCDLVSESALRVSLSLGCAVKDNPEDELQSVLQQAEEHMYHQKLLDGKSYRNAIINALLATLYEKSIETEEHTERLETFCRVMGEKLQLSSKEIDELSLLAILHDIGKVGVNPDILQKPNILSPSEWEEMKRHPEIGYRIAQATPELAIVADFILSHHERWDGKGYPRGLKAEEIPLACRILAIADAYDAMTNNRAYRKAMSKEEAVTELIINAGTQFDPSIVGLFVETVVT